MLLILIAPNLLLGIIAIFIPYVYAAVPVYETSQCMHFYERTPFYNWFGLSVETQCILQIVNVSVFIIVNWLQILILIIAYQRLNNIKDELNIKRELRLIIVMWVSFSILYFATLQLESSVLEQWKHGTAIAIFVFI